MGVATPRAGTSRQMSGTLGWLRPRLWPRPRAAEAGVKGPDAEGSALPPSAGGDGPADLGAAGPGALVLLGCTPTLPAAPRPERHGGTTPEDNRTLLRQAAQLPLVYRVPRGRVHRSEAGWTRDLSEGGIGLELPERLRKDTRLALRLGTALGVVWAEGEVVWVGLPTAPTGGTPHGIRLAEIHPTQQEKLSELLRALARAPHAASRLPLNLAVTCQPLHPGGPSLPGRTINVGRGGLALQFPAMLPPGTAVQLTLRPTRRPLRMEGVIAWVEPEDRRVPPDPLITHGLQFTGLDWALARTLGALLMEIG